MRRAHARSAHRTQTFWFRKHMGPPAAGTVGDPDEYEEMTVEEILTGKGVAVVDRSIDTTPALGLAWHAICCRPHPNPSPSPEPGKGEYFPGLMPLVRAYLEAIGCDPETGEKVGEYMELLTT